MIIANYTPDDIKYVHGGIPGIIKSGTMEDMPEAKANFLVNKFDQRGLLKLQFGDDPEEKKAEAMQIYREFWTRQVVNHNQANEKRQARNLEFSRAPGEVERHAKELGLKLLGPWTATSDESVEMKQLRNDNSELTVRMNSMADQLAKALSILEKKGLVETPEQKFPEVPPKKEEKTVEEATEEALEDKTEIAEEAAEALNEAEEAIRNGPNEDVVNTISRMTNEQLVAWVMDNATPIMNEYDYATQAYVRETWKKVCTEDWPLPI